MCRAAVCAGDRTEAHQDGPVSKAYAQYPAPSVVFMRRQALTIDATRCQGHGRCMLINPDLFEMNDDVAHLHPANPYARFYVDPYEVTKLKQLLHACDAVRYA